jgi:hypothetical protein
MTNRFMISVAVVALIAGTGLASAQSGGMGREGGSAAQQNGASSEHGTSGGQMGHDAARPEMKSTQSEEKSPAAGKNQRAEESRQGSKNKAQNSENAEKGKTVGQSMNNEGREENKNSQRNDEKMNTQRRDENGNKNAQRNDEKMNAQRNDQKMNNEAEGKTDRHSTVGQAGAGAKLSTEQRTKITTVIRDQHIAPVSHVDFSISVGTRVPRDVTFHTLPTEVVSIYPEWRGYEYILVGDQLVVIDPRSMEIVAVLDT